MPQQSQIWRPRVTDLQPWQTDAPLDKSADLPLGRSAVRRLNSRACERKLPKKQNDETGWPQVAPQIFKFLKPDLEMASPSRLSTRRFGVRKPAQV
jgi:hypothetical protein